MNNEPHAFLDHRRSWRSNTYVYPVLSRRSKGISLGINLNIDKICNFDCVYCEVDRKTSGKPQAIHIPTILTELESLIGDFRSGRLFDGSPFSEIPEHLRVLNDVAFSGDGEPTTVPEFESTVRAVALLLDGLGLNATKIILITDASKLQSPEVIRGIDQMFLRKAEVWAKLDAGTESYYQTINRTSIPFEKILNNLLFAAQRWPLVVQSLFLEWQSSPPSDDEIKKFAYVLKNIIHSGGRLELLQVYTIARPTPEPEARPLSMLQLKRISDLISQENPTLPIEIFP